MVWNYPDISLEEMVKLIKGFVDVLILASGYQSSGLLAHWDSQNIKKAFQWASFFENVLGLLGSSDVYQDSVKEFDAAVREITCNPSFPQGLANLSYDALKRARTLVLEHLLHTLPLRDSHLRLLLTAIIEMDLEKLSGSENDCLGFYLNMLTMQNAPFNLLSERRALIKDSVIALKDEVPTMETGKCTDDDLTKFTHQELLKRQSAVSGVLTTATGLDILSNAIGCGNWTYFRNSLSGEQLEHERAPLPVGSVDQLANFITWNRWKSSNLSYFLHKRTVRLVSGASMIFSAPKFDWMQVLERLNTSAKCKKENDLLETMEILLIGCVTSKWNCLIEYFMSVSYDSFTISKLFLEVCNLLSGRPLCFHSKDSTYSKESGILDYLVGLLDGQFHELWKLSPALMAVAIPLWSPLFRLYLSEIETRFKGDASAIRCCSCIQDRKEHEDCQLAERIWCLYIFHVCGAHVMYGTNNA